MEGNAEKNAGGRRGALCYFSRSAYHRGTTSEARQEREARARRARRARVCISREARVWCCVLFYFSLFSRSHSFTLLLCRTLQLSFIEYHCVTGVSRLLVAILKKSGKSQRPKKGLFYSVFEQKRGQILTFKGPITQKRYTVSRNFDLQHREVAVHCKVDGHALGVFLVDYFFNSFL